MGDDYILTASVTKAQFDDPNIDPNAVVVRPLRRCILVPTDYLRFGRKLPEFGGGTCPFPYTPGSDTTCPGVNGVGIQYEMRWSAGSSLPPDVAFLPFALSPAAAQSSIIVTGSATQLSFQAMAPIVLIHGWNSGPWQWGPETPDPAGVCRAGELGSDKGRATINTLVTAKVPFDCLIRIGRQESIDVGTRVLLSGATDPNTGRLLSYSVAQVAAQFGSRHVHIVTNSKGGIFTRGYMDLDAAAVDVASRIGIISATTIDTPHAGSPIADTAFAYMGGVRSVLPFGYDVGYRLGTLIPNPYRRQLLNTFGQGSEDMTTSEMAEYDRRHRAPPREYHLQIEGKNFKLANPAYHSASGDADLNHDGALQDAEAALYTPFAARFQWQRIRTTRSITVTRDPQTRRISAVFDPSQVPRENDTAVPIDSARYTDFQEIRVYSANHATVLCPQSGVQPLGCAPIQGPISDILSKIRSAELNLDEQVE